MSGRCREEDTDGHGSTRMRHPATGWSSDEPRHTSYHDLLGCGSLRRQRRTLANVWARWTCCITECWKNARLMCFNVLCV